jgi:RES domain-containing protein
LQSIAARFWRVLAPRWANEPLSGAGSARHGGRWNAAGTPALYMSAELTTAVAEYEQDLGIRPGTFCAYDVAVEGVLDLRDPAVLAARGIDPADRFCAWKAILALRKERPPGWRIAETLALAGAAGILVPSVQMAGGTNLVLWHWNDMPERRVLALDPLRDLPADQASWPQQTRLAF